MRFINGQAITKARATIPEIMVILLNCSKIIKPKESKEANNNKVSKRLIFFAANGLFFVLSTFGSKFLSEISLIIHPADLIITDPVPNKNIIQDSSDKLSSTFLSDKNIPNKQGKNSKAMPMGLRIRVKFT